MTDNGKPRNHGDEIADLLAERDARTRAEFTPPRPDMHTITEDEDADQVSGAWGILAGVLVAVPVLLAVVWVAG